MSKELRHYTDKEVFNKYIKKTRIEVHPDGVKEVPDECPFCEVPCMNEWCVYTPKEEQ